MKLKMEFHYVNRCPRVNEMLKNIDDALVTIDFEVELLNKVINTNEHKKEGFGCPTLLVEGYDLIGKIKCDQKEPFCRIYPKGMPSVEEIRKFIISNY